MTAQKAATAKAAEAHETETQTALLLEIVRAPRAQMTQTAA